MSTCCHQDENYFPTTKNFNISVHTSVLYSTYICICTCSGLAPSSATIRGSAPPSNKACKIHNMYTVNEYINIYL